MNLLHLIPVPNPQQIPCVIVPLLSYKTPNITVGIKVKVPKYYEFSL